jgi:hypothetical protein
MYTQCSNYYSYYCSRPRRINTMAVAFLTALPITRAPNYNYALKLGITIKCILNASTISHKNNIL